MTPYRSRFRTMVHSLFRISNPKRSQLRNTSQFQFAQSLEYHSIFGIFITLNSAPRQLCQISIDSLKAALVKLDANVSVEDILSVVQEQEFNHVEVVLRYGQGKSSTTFSNPSHTPDPLAPAPIDSQPSLAKYDFRFVTPTVSKPPWRKSPTTPQCLFSFNPSHPAPASLPLLFPIPLPVALVPLSTTVSRPLP